MRTAVLLLFAPALVGGIIGYSEQLPAGNTGGFGEPTCHQCHFENPVNDGKAVLRLEGATQPVSPGEKQVLSVHLTREDLKAGGFQISARSEESGAQAGRFVVLDDRTEITEDDSTGIQYIHHSKAGVSPTGEEEIVWCFEWIAPELDAPDVIFHLTANAANNDDSEFGDHIYTLELPFPGLTASH